MKVKDAIANVDKTRDAYGDMGHLSSALNLNVYGDWTKFDQRIKKYWIISWLCSDTYVGYAAWFFDDKPFAVSYQSARKSDERFEFISADSARQVRDFLLSLDRDYKISIVNLEEDIPERFGLESERHWYKLEIK